MDEEAFIQLIDANFPYDREKAWRGLIELSKQISPNAAFAVLNEICRPPFKGVLKSKRAKDMLDFWSAHIDHPLKVPLLTAAEALISRRDLSVEQAVAIMRMVAGYREQYCALMIAYMSCDDREGVADEAYNEIVKGWEA